MARANICTKCGAIIIGGTKCLVCGAPQLIPLNAPLAQKMIIDTGQQDAAAKALTAAAQATTRNRIVIAALVFAGFLLLVVVSYYNGSDDEAKQPAPAAPANDAELLLSRCGPPSLDDSTAYDNPRPPIPSRIIEYKAAKLRIMFIPGDGSLGDPPPYRWKLVGATDMSSKDPSKARVVSAEEFVQRLPCFKGAN